MRQKNRQQKDYCVFFLYFFLVLDGRDGQRRWHVSDPWEGRASDGHFGDPFCSVAFMLLCFFFPFLLNLYIEAGLVYRTLSLQKDRVGILGQKGQESRTFPRNCPNGGRMSLLQSPSLFCLIFLRLLLSDEEQLKLESLRSLTADELCAGWPEVLQDNPKASTQSGDLSRFKGDHSQKRHKTEKDCI